MNGCLSWLFSWFLPTQIPYELAKLRTRSLDMVYFCQLGTWTGPFVALFAGKMITHMGVIWRHPETGELYVLESVRHPDTAQDILDHGKVHTGVRLVSLHEKLRHPKDRYFVCIQPLLMENNVRDRAEELFNRFILAEAGKPFQDNVLTYFRAQLNRNSYGYQSEDLTSLFCSELAALALRDCGLLKGVDNVNGVWPSMLYTCQFQLEPGARLSPTKFLIRLEPEMLDARPVPPPPPRLVKAVSEASTLDDFVARVGRRDYSVLELLDDAKSAKK